MLDVVVGFLLVDCQLLSAILQAEHPQTIVELLLIDTVLALHLSVVAGCGDADAVIGDLVFLQLEFKQALVVRVVRDQRASTLNLDNFFLINLLSMCGASSNGIIKYPGPLEHPRY